MKIPKVVTDHPIGMEDAFRNLFRVDNGEAVINGFGPLNDIARLVIRHLDLDIDPDQDDMALSCTMLERTSLGFSTAEGVLAYFYEAAVAAAELRAHLQVWEQAGSWRDARSDPPDNENEVVVCTRTKKGLRNVDKGYYFDGRWVHRGTSEVTHWMPLPEMPEDER